MKTRGKQLDLPLRRWGGKRRGAGRKPKGTRAGVSHRPRPALASRYPVHVTLRLHDEAPNLREGRVYELIHAVNSLRKERGLELTDRIALTIPEADADLLEHRDWIARETLATSVEASGSEIAIAKSR